MEAYVRAIIIVTLMMQPIGPALLQMESAMEYNAAHDFFINGTMVGVNAML